MISIIVGTLNRPLHLRAFLYALRIQTLQIFEVLVMDEGENDWLDSFDDERVQRIKCEKVGDWHYTVKERGARLAQYDYLCFPNDDTYYAPPFLERMTDLLNKGADLAYCDFIFDQVDYQRINAEPKVGKIDIGGFVVRKDVFFTYGFDKGKVADGNFVEKVALHHNVAKTNEVLYVKN